MLCLAAQLPQHFHLLFLLQMHHHCRDVWNWVRARERSVENITAGRKIVSVIKKVLSPYENAVAFKHLKINKFSLSFLSSACCILLNNKKICKNYLWKNIFDKLFAVRQKNLLKKVKNVKSLSMKKKNVKLATFYLNKFWCARPVNIENSGHWEMEKYLHYFNYFNGLSILRIYGATMRMSESDSCIIYFLNK